MLQFLTLITIKINSLLESIVSNTIIPHFSLPKRVFKPSFWVMLAVIVLCFGFISTTQTYAQQAITGSVRDDNQQVIPGATIKLTGAALPDPIELMAQENGEFAINQITAGEYTLSVMAEGFNSRAVTVIIAPRAFQLVNVTLQPASVTDVIEVKADRLLLDESQGASLSVVDTVFTDQLPSGRKTNIPDLISSFVPSAVSSHDNFVHLRGNELSLNTSINGVSFIDNPHQYFAPGLDPDVIQSFSVITGGFPAEYGNRFGGIVDAVTRSGFDSNSHGQISFGASTFVRNNTALEYGGHTKRFGYFFYAAGLQSTRFINPSQPKELHDFGEGLRTFTQFDLRANTNNTFRLLLFNSGSNFQIPNTPEEQNNGRDLFQRSREQTAIFTWERILSGNSLLVTSLSERLVSNRSLPTSDPISINASGLRNTITLGLRSDYTHTFGSRHTFKTGIELNGYRLREDFQFDPRDQLEEDSSLTAFNFRGRKTGGVGAFYVQDKIRIKNFTTNIGLRYDQYSVVTSEHQVSPRINLAYTFSRTSTVLHFAYNRFFALPPNENLLLSTQLQTNGIAPQPSRSNFYELGISQAVKNKALIRITTYYRRDKNAFELTELTNVREFLPTTFARGKSYGAELSIQIPEIPKLGISAYLNYAAQRTFQIGPISGGFSDDSLAPGERMLPAFDQIQNVKAGFTYQEKRSGLFAGMSFEYGSGTPKENLRLPSHFVANLSTGIDLIRGEKHKISLQFNVENIGNRVYAIAKESDFTPLQFSPPRFVSGGIHIHF